METVDVSIVIPAFNEEYRIGSTIESIFAFMANSTGSFEIVVVDDGSSDGTAALVGRYNEIRLVRFPQNKGKGAAVAAGVAVATGEMILFLDADGSTPIAELTKLRNSMEVEGADIAIGSRAMRDKDSTLKTVWYRKLIGRCFHFLVSTIGVAGLKDTQCGFKLFKANIAKKLFSEMRCKGFAFDVEILLRAREQGIRVVEVPISWSNVEGSKVNLLIDPFKMLCDVLLMRTRLLLRNALR